MNIFKADENLARVLINHGFVETTSEIDKRRERRQFKILKKSRVNVCFDHTLVKIMKSSNIMYFTNQMNEEELKLLLFYIELSSADRKKFSNSGFFKITDMKKSLSLVFNEICDLKELNLNHTRQKQLEKIIEAYNSIEL